MPCARCPQAFRAWSVRHAGRKCGSLFLSPILLPKHKKKRPRSSVTAEKDTVIRWRHGSRSAPDCLGSFNNKRQLGALVRFGKRVSSHGAGEAALGADRQTIVFDVTRGILGTTLQIAQVLNCRRLCAHEAEHNAFALRNET